jgi:tRNA dimethylallyltransferase
VSGGSLIVIGGTTASGKSALALRLAERLGGVVVNADSMQLYRDLRIITARPSAADEARVEHRLYGVLDAAQTGSVGEWLQLVGPVLQSTVASGRPAIIVGGTGFYLHALLHGIAVMPDIPPDLRASVRAWADGRPTPELHARLAGIDPVMAARLRPSDRQRILRALEIWQATGRSLAEWQAQPHRRIPLPRPVRGVAILSSAERLRPRILDRLRTMLKERALDEVARLIARRDVPLDAPILRATGVPELRRVLEGGLNSAAALEAAAATTRHYAKRQRTFFRHQLPELIKTENDRDAEAALSRMLSHKVAD